VWERKKLAGIPSANQLGIQHRAVRKVDVGESTAITIGVLASTLQSDALPVEEGVRDRCGSDPGAVWCAQFRGIDTDKPNSLAAVGNECVPVNDPLDLADRLREEW